jgi:hypothetical protein
VADEIEEPTAGGSSCVSLPGYIGDANPADLAGALCAELEPALIDNLFFPANGRVTAYAQGMCNACPAGRATGNGKCWELAKTASDGEGIWDGEHARALGPHDLTADQVRDIRARYAAGHTYLTIGKAHRRSAKTVQDIVTGRTWAHVA